MIKIDYFITDIVEENNKIKESENKIADIKRQVLLKQEYEQTITECKDNIEKKKLYISSLKNELITITTAVPTHKGSQK